MICISELILEQVYNLMSRPSKLPTMSGQPWNFDYSKINNNINNTVRSSLNSNPSIDRSAINSNNQPNNISNINKAKSLLNNVNLKTSITPTTQFKQDSVNLLPNQPVKSSYQQVAATIPGSGLRTPPRFRIQNFLQKSPMDL